MGEIIAQHGRMYWKEYQWNADFEAYVGEGLLKMYRNFNPEKDFITIAKDQNQIIGSCFILQAPNGDAQLRFFYLNAEYRGQGIGKTMIEQCINFCESHAYQRIFLWTTSNLLPALSLYRSLGFTEIESKTHPLFGQEITELCFERML
jgi:ribosomal protein S18 acetylase RimI-like enzyme